MSTPYIGEIRLFSFGTRGAPIGWQACVGSLLPISEYDALFSLIGTTYGGDGQSTFALPDLRGRVPVGGAGAWGGRVGSGVPLGGPEGKKGMRDLLDEKKMVHGATQMVHCFCNRGIGFRGYEDIINSAGVLQSCISVLVIGV